MEQTNPPKASTVITEIVAGINLVQVPFEVRVPIFQDVEVERPKWVEKQIEIPSGWDRVINAIALELADKIMAECLKKLDKSLQDAISARISEIKYPRLVEELKITEVPKTVEIINYVPVDIKVPRFVDHEVINPVKKDVEVINCIIIDKPVLNAVITDVNVTNAIVRDVEVERAVIREKTIDVIHKNCFSQDGKPLV